jgi:hypothetical protein
MPPLLMLASACPPTPPPRPCAAPPLHCSATTRRPGRQTCATWHQTAATPQVRRRPCLLRRLAEARARHQGSKCAVCSRLLGAWSTHTPTLCVSRRTNTHAHTHTHTHTHTHAHVHAHAHAHAGQLTRLILPGVGLTCPSFPQQLSQLTALRRLDLSANNFAGVGAATCAPALAASVPAPCRRGTLLAACMRRRHAPRALMFTPL